MPSLQSLIARGVDLDAYLSARGLAFQASDADQNDTITGQTSFAATAPTFQIDVPTTHVLIPKLVRLYPTGTVAGGVITVIIEKDNADRYASGGSTQTVYNDKGNSPNCTLRTGATANSGFGTPLMQIEFPADVDEAAAEFYPREILWTPGNELHLIGADGGGGAFNVFTYASSTGPTWMWGINWYEVPVSWAS